MGKVLRYFDFINESVLSLDDVYAKWYSELDRKTFDEITKADPTTKPNKIGTYSKWLLNLYNNKKLKLEDLYKATSYLNAFNKFKHKVSVKDITLIKSLPDLFKIVEPYIEKEEDADLPSDELKLKGEYAEVFKNKNFRVIVPYTLRASKYFGCDSEWCTLNTDMFDRYTSDQKKGVIDENCLYIIYTNNPDDRMQFSFAYKQYMDIYDSPIDIVEFLTEDNEDLFEFFKKHFDVDVYIYLPDVLLYDQDRLSKYGLKVLDTDGEDLRDYNEQNPNWRDDADVLINATHGFTYDENPMDGSILTDFDFMIKDEKTGDKFEKALKDIFKHNTINYVEEDDGVNSIRMY